MLAPFAKGLQIEFVLGLLVLARATMQLYYGFKVRRWGHVIGSYMGMGSILMSNVSVACATVLLLDPISDHGLTPIVLSAYLLLSGVLDILHAFELRPVPGWASIIAGGLVAMVMAFVVWSGWAFAGDHVYGLALGACFIAASGALILLGLISRAVAKSATAVPVESGLNQQTA